MEVTKVTISEYNPKPKGVCAECSIVLDDELSIHKIQILRGKRGLYINFPNTGLVYFVNGKKRYKDLVRPINNDLRMKISEAILKAYAEQE
jgi:DNA-binding cell septation regulator SpoVG